MSCSIIRNNDDKIIKVLDPKTGKESKVFNQIASLPHVKDLEQAVEIYDEILKASEKELFPNSKVRGEDGKLLKLYHGGPIFDAFKTPDSKDKGIYFTDNKFFATDVFALQAELRERDRRGDDYSDVPEDMLESGNWDPKYFKYAEVKEVFLNMENPKVVEGIDAKDIPKNYDSNSDGFIAKNTGDFGYKGGQYVVFDPKQIDVISKENSDIDLDQARTESLAKWIGNRDVVSGADIGDIETGTPVVVRVYHGTTNDFDVFNSEVKGNVEGHLGKINYFTSDYNDASGNYQADGADITGRIDRRQDELEDTLRYDYADKTDQGLLFGQIVEDFNITEAEVMELYPDGAPEFIQPEEISRFLAEKELLGNDEKVLDLYVRMDNPVVLGTKSTWFEAFELDEDYLEEAAEEVAEENDITVEEAKEDYEWDIRDRAMEMTGYENTVTEALSDALVKNGYPSEMASEIVEVFDMEIDLNELEDKIRKSELYDNDMGELASSQVISDFFQNLGFDGIVLNNVAERFPGMRLGGATSHVHIFDENNNNIKSAEDNFTYDETKENIFYSLEVEGQKYPNFISALRNAGGKVLDLVSNNVKVASFPLTLDERTLPGAINSFISDGIIDSNKVTLNGKTYFKPVGENYYDKEITREFFKEVAGETLDKDQYDVVNGLVEIREAIKGVSPDSSEHKVISNKLLEYFSNDTVVSKKEPINEANLKLNLMKILSDMGVSVMSLKQYQDRFKAKSDNIPPSAEALADIANRVIAFKDGKLNLGNLTEEVMHLIVETLPQEQIASFREAVLNSEEYQDYYEQYKDVYNNDDALIEKEILGKMMRNIALNKTENTNQSLVSRIMDAIRNFFANLTMTQSHKDQLEQLNGLVERFVIEQNGENFTEDDLAQSREIALMYSLSDQVSNTQGALEKTFRNVTDFRQFNSYKRELKNISFEKLQGRELAVAVSRFIEMSTKLIETTDSAIQTAKNKRKALSGQNKAILEDLHGEIASHLDSLAVELSTPQPGIDSNERVKLAEKLKENSARISELRALNDQTTDDHINQMVDEVVEQMGQAESEFYRNQVEKVLRGEIEDTNKIFSFFGQLHHASNPVLNMIGSKIWEMNMKANEGIKEDMSPFLNYMSENPNLRKDFESLFKDGYLTDVVDHKGFDDALLNAEMEAFSESSGQTFENLEAYRQAKIKDELTELSEEKYGKYRTLLQQKQLPLVETVMNEKYYQDLFDKYERLNISGATQLFLKENSAQRGAIKANATKTYIDGNGVEKTRVVLTPEDNDNLNSISKIRRARKNIYSETSTLKKGLKLSDRKPEGDSVVLPTGQYLSLDIREGMSQGEIDFANIAFDLHKLDKEYIDQIEKEGSSPNTTTGRAKLNFLAYIKSIQDNHSEKEVLDVIMSNLDISLSKEFYDTLNGDSFLKGTELDDLNPNNPQLVRDVKALYAKRNAILSMYRNTSSPFETDKMTPSDQEAIRSLSTRISDALRVLNLPEGVEENESAGEKAPNKTYIQELDRRGIQENSQEELDFLINYQHTNIPQLNKLKDAYYKNQSGLPLSDSDARMLAKYEARDLLQTQLNYAKANLQPYYTRFAPVGYKSVEERLRDGDSILQVLNSIFNNQYLNVRIDNSFEEKDNPLKNPNYDDNYDGGFRQPKKGTFVNKDFINKFGINERGEATKNKELFEARRLYLEARKKGLEKMNEGAANPYKAIQISKTTTEKVRTLAQGKGKRSAAAELLKDTFAYRVDDIAYGEQGFETNKVLPKYYMRDLEDPNDVSTDYIFALSQFVSRANEYKAKRNVVSDIDALYDVLLRSKRHSKSKTLKNTIAMADSYIENSIYGKIENRTYEVKVPGTDYSMDLAKVSRVFTKYVSLKNLGFNTTVPLTGLFSGLVSKRVEEWIGEKLNRDSARLANAEYKKLFKDGSSQALDFNDNSKLFLIGQAFGIYDISEKARNAKYNKFQRTFSKSAMGLHTMANYPIIPKIALSVMYDNRAIDGQIMNRQQYFQEKTREGVPAATIETNWKAAEENAIYNYMNFSKTGFSWDSGIEELIPDKKYLENRKLFMMKFIRAQISNVDATIPKEMRLAAQRDALGSMMLLHKGFLSIFLQNRLKRRAVNIDTGLLEEGSYRTLTRLMADFFNTKGGMSAKIDKLKSSIQPPSKDASNDEWLEYELNIRNMKRIGRELASMGVLVTLGALVFAAASDPDNEDIYALQMSSYLMTRLLNESGTAFTPSILTDLSDVIESPIVTYDTGKEFAQFYKLFDGEEITRGKYKGLSVRERWITKNVLGFKGIYDVWSADNIRDSESTYRLYNEENINRATLGLNSLYKGMYKD